MGIIIGISGATGAIFGIRLLEAGYTVEQVEQIADFTYSNKTKRPRSASA